MNTNAVHNFLNFTQMLLAAMLGFNYQDFGLSPSQSASIVGGIMLAANALKLGINIHRDGIGGLVMKQPPVVKNDADMK